MFEFKADNGFTVVRGYDDGSDWTFEGGYFSGLYGAARDHLWELLPDALRLRDLENRQILATIALDLHAENPERAIARGNGERVYVIYRREIEFGPDGKLMQQGAIAVVDLAQREVVARLCDLPPSMDTNCAVMADGSLICPVMDMRDDRIFDRLIRIDGSDWSVSHSEIASEKLPDTYLRIHWCGHSPDGRWWLRFDHTSLPVADHPPGPGEPPRRYYGATYQLWSAFPLRFERRIVVTWLDPKLDTVLPTIAQALNRPDAPPDAPFPARADFGPQAVDDRYWKSIVDRLEKLSRNVLRRIRAWQDDGEAFWLQTDAGMICVGVDGAVSPTIRWERKDVGQLDALPGRRLLVSQAPRKGTAHFSELEGGSMIVDGAPADIRFEPRVIPLASDGWRSGPEAAPALLRSRQDDEAKVRALKADRSKVGIPLAGLDPASRAAAIGTLADAIDASFLACADGHTIDIGFELDGKVIPEREFFEAIGPGDRAWAVPALRRLVQRYVEAERDHRDTFYQPKGESVLAQAVLRLGELDHASLPLVTAFGEQMDGGHEYFFAGETMPAIVRAHGWTDDVIRFVFWAMLYSFYNTYDSASGVWSYVGLRDGVAGLPPEAVAEAVAAEFGPLVASRRLEWTSLGLLKMELGDTANAWERRFLDEIERRVPGATELPD